MGLKLAEAKTVEEAKKTLDTDKVKRFRKLLRPGDLLFSAPDRQRATGFLGKVFKPFSRAVQGTDYGHVAIYAGDDKIIESRIGEGVTKKPLLQLTRSNDVVAARVSATPKERRAALLHAEGEVGKPYAMGKLLVAALPVRGKRQGLSPEKAQELQCAALIANAYARKKFSEHSRLSTRPSEILESPEVRPLGALTRFNKTASRGGAHETFGVLPRKLVLPR